MVTKPHQSREPVGVEMRGKKGLAGGKRVEMEVEKKQLTGEPDFCLDVIEQK